MAKFKKAVAVEIRNLMLARTGIDLETYSDHEANGWPQRPRGFRFTAGNKKSQNFERLLQKNPKIAFWPHFSSHQTKVKRRREYREISTKDSLHIILSTGKPYSSWKKKVANWYWEVHLDTVSVCRSTQKGYYGRECGQIDLYYGIKHLLKDYVKWI